MTGNAPNAAPSSSKSSMVAKRQSHNDDAFSASEIQSRPLYRLLQEGEIRLIILARGGHKDPLKGRLVSVSRSFSNEKQGFEEKFMALSYTWGDQSEPVTIELNGHEVPIGRNLESAMIRVRLEESERVLWIDALCINQEDNVEKSNQIQKMPVIYESAIATIIWLGDEFEGVEEAFAWLRKLPALPSTEVNSFEKLNALLNTQVAATLAKLLSLPWWRRAWIIQEAAVCQEAIVTCGPFTISYSSFITLANLLNTFLNTGEISRKECPYSLLMPAAQDLLTLAEIRCGWRRCDRGVHPMDLESLVDRTYLRVLATDPRDRFYALLSITTNEDWLALMPDYAITRDAVFFKATLHLIRKKSSLDILQLGENLHHSEEDPSWLPGWDQGSRSLVKRALITGHASKGIKLSLSTSEDLRVITLSGLVIGTLDLVSRFQPEEDRFQPPSCILQWLEMLENLDFASTDPYTKTCGLIEAFARSLVAGNEMLVPGMDVSGNFPMRNVFRIWTTMAGPESNVPPAWRRLQESTMGLDWDPYLTPATIFRRHALQCLDRRSFVITRNGYIGLAPDDAREGDIAALIGGSSTPICLRPEHGHFRWIGAMYLHDLMRGELVEKLTAANGGALTDFEIQ